MRAVLGVAVAALSALFVLTMFVQIPNASAAAQRYFSKYQIDIGQEFAHQRRWLFWGSTAVHFGFLVALVYLGFGRRLSDWGSRRTGKRWLLTLVVVWVVCFLLDEILRLPFRLAGLELSRHYEMTVMTWPAWFEDFAKTLALNGLLGLGIIIGLYVFMAWLPRAWWIVAGLASVLLACLFALILPLWVSPLFNEFRPLIDPQLEKAVRELADRAGVPVSEVLVMDASRRSRGTNAYFTGLGATRRIVLYDTLLKHGTPVSATATLGLLPSPLGQGPFLAGFTLVAERAGMTAELESILAHEIGHWQHDHIVKGISLASLGAFLGLFLLSLILKWNVGRPPLYLRSPTDPAGIPLVLLLFFLGNWAVMPLENAVSRSFERQADWTSLELTRDPRAFIESEKTMTRDNLGNVAPNPVTTWFFSTHPTAVERIQMAEEWQLEHARQ